MEANNKAMREAVKVIRGIVNEELEDLKDISDEVRADFISIRGWCDHALSKPPRNCDVGTARQQEKRHKEEACLKSACPKHEGFVSKACKGCFAMWSQMPYEEGGAK